MSADDDKMWPPPQEHPFLTARHVDDLTEAVRGLTRQFVEAARNHQEAVDMQRRQLEVLRGIQESADALRDLLVKQRTNGAHPAADETAAP